MGKAGVNSEKVFQRSAIQASEWDPSFANRRLCGRSIPVKLRDRVEGKAKEGSTYRSPRTYESMMNFGCLQRRKHRALVPHTDSFVGLEKSNPVSHDITRSRG